jgi:hypothetical protein
MSNSKEAGEAAHSQAEHRRRQVVRYAVLRKATLSFPSIGRERGSDLGDDFLIIFIRCFISHRDLIAARRQCFP